MADFTIQFVVSRAESQAALAAEIAAYKATAKEADATAKKVAAASAQGAKEQKQAAKEVSDAQKQAAKEAKEAQKAANDEMARAEAIGGKFLGVLNSIGGATIGISGIASVIGLVTEAFEQAKKQAMEAGKFVEDYRQSLKELAFLKGEPGATSPIVRADLEFRQKTLQDQGGARSLQEEFRNVAGISIDTADTKRRMSKEEADKAMIYAGQQQAMFGGEGGAYGKLAGLIPATEGKDRVTSDDVKRRMYQLSLIGQSGGASPSQFANQMAESSYLTTTGAYKDFSRQAAVGSALSLATPSQIGTGLDQLHRLTTGSLSDQSASKGAEMSPADYLKSIGATDQMDDLSILQKMFRDVEKAEKVSAAKGEKLNLTTYLKSRGYQNVQDIGRFSQLYGSKNDLEKTLLPMAEKLPTTGEADSQFNQFKATQSGLQQRSAVDADRAKFAAGGGAMEYYKSIQQQAYNSMSAEEQAWGTIEDYQNAGMFSGKSGVLDARAAEIIRQEGIKKKLGYARQYYEGNRGEKIENDPLSDLFSGQAGGKTRAEAFYKRAQEISQAGGDPLGANSDIMQRMEESLKRSADTLDKTERALRGIRDKLDPAPVQTVKPGGANALPVR